MSTSDASKQPNVSVEEVAQQFLNKSSNYFQSEVRRMFIGEKKSPENCDCCVLVIAADYDCLNKMNAASLEKYKEMGGMLERVNTSVRSMNESNRENRK